MLSNFIIPSLDVSSNSVLFKSIRPIEYLSAKLLNPKESNNSIVSSPSEPSAITGLDSRKGYANHRRFRTLFAASNPNSKSTRLEGCLSGNPQPSHVTPKR